MVLQGEFEFFEQAAPLPYLFILHRIIEMVARLIGDLGLIHGLMGVAQQGLGSTLVSGTQGDSHAC